MPVDPSWVGVGGVAAALITPVFAYAAGNRSGKAEFINAVSKASEVLMQRLHAEIERVDKARQHCEEGHLACEAKLTEFRVEIDRMMNGRIADYHERAPSGGEA